MIHTQVFKPVDLNRGLGSKRSCICV